MQCCLDCWKLEEKQRRRILSTMGWVKFCYPRMRTVSKLPLQWREEQLFVWFLFCSHPPGPQLSSPAAWASDGLHFLKQPVARAHVPVLGLLYRGWKQSIRIPTQWFLRAGLAVHFSGQEFMRVPSASVSWGSSWPSGWSGHSCAFGGDLLSLPLLGDIWVQKGPS